MQLYTRKTPFSQNNFFVGAWWLGWIIIGSLMFLFAVLIGMFPKHLPPKQKKVKIDNDKEKFDYMETKKTKEVEQIEEIEEKPTLKGGINILTKAKT